MTKIEKVHKEIFAERVENPEEFIEKFVQRHKSSIWGELNYEANTNQYLADSLEKLKDTGLYIEFGRKSDVTEHFKKVPGREIGTFFMYTNHLRLNRGNPTNDQYKIDRIKDAIESGDKMPTPQWWLGDGELGEGNHRTKVMKEMGYRVIPVRIYD